MAGMNAAMARATSHARPWVPAFAGMTVVGEGGA